MKKYITLLLLSLLVTMSSAIAQLSGGNLFLKGNFLEVGFQANGAMGATSGIPAGFHPHSSGSAGGGSLASVYDYTRDGWTVGTPPYMGDYTMVGTPYEMWGIQVGSVRTHAAQQAPSGVYYNSGSGIGLYGVNTGYSLTAMEATGYWDGTAMTGQLQIHKEMNVPINGTALKIKVKLKNVGATPLSNIYYIRSCDPDVDGSWPSGSFATNNTIIHQGSTDNKHFVQASSMGSYPLARFGLAAKDARARVFIYSDWALSTSVNLANLHNGTYTPAVYGEGMTWNGDIAIGITFSLGTLAAGDSTEFTYAYMYGGAATFDSVFALPCSGTPVAGTIAANSSTACSTSSISLLITGTTLVTGLGYQWQSSNDSMTWANIPSATTNGYTISGLTATTYYRCIVTCTGTGLSDTTAGKKIVYSTICPCLVQDAGMVLPSTLSSCDTATITLNNSGYTALPTIGLQWQKSADSVTWTDIAGATSVPYSFSGLTSTTYYRLKTTCIATGVMVASAGKKITYTVLCNCSGSPVLSTAIASSTYCSSCALTLSLSGISAMPGLTYQWQRTQSLSSGWSNITGATTSPYIHTPTETYYYRCNVSCGSSTTTSSNVLVITPHTILIDSVTRSPDTVCSGQRFYVLASGNSPLMKVKTYFGDGSSVINSLISFTPNSFVNIAHTYTHPFSYPVKHVLYCDTMAQDSVTFTYEHPYCNLLSIKFFADLNLDCNKNTSEVFMSTPLNIKVDSAGIAIDTITTPSGFYYKAYGPAGTVYRMSLISTNVFPVCPMSAIVVDTIKTGNYLYPTHFIALNCSSTLYDIAIYPYFRAFTNIFQTATTVRNLQCSPQSVTTLVSFSPRYKNTPSGGYYFAPSLYSFTDYSNTWIKNGVSIVGNKLQTSHKAHPDPSLPPLIIGDTVSATFKVSPIIGDLDTTNNYIIITDTIQGPFDPNMIQVLPNGCYDNDTTLQYTVHFENKGNDTAHNVYVMDTLSDNLVASSLEVLAASADMFTHEYKDGPYHIVRFDFPGIKLLDSSWFGLNAGMFVFKIKTKPGLANGQMIHNRVGIYFDNNEVIMTNTASNIKGCPTTQVKNINTTDDVLLYPNPVTDVLTIIAQPGSYTTLTVTNAVGQQMVQQNITQPDNKVNVKNLPPGVYSITLSGAQHNVTKRFVKW